MTSLNATTFSLILFAVVLLLSLAHDLGSLLLQVLPADRRGQVATIVGDVVHATEQAAGAIPGAQKKQMALQMIGVLLKQARLTASPEQLDVLLEAAVHAMNLAAAAVPQALPAVAQGVAELATTAAAV